APTPSPFPTTNKIERGPKAPKPRTETEAFRFTPHSLLNKARPRALGRSAGSFPIVLFPPRERRTEEVCPARGGSVESFCCLSRELYDLFPYWKSHPSHRKHLQCHDHIGFALFSLVVQRTVAPPTRKGINMETSLPFGSENLWRKSGFKFPETARLYSQREYAAPKIIPSAANVATKLFIWKAPTEMGNSPIKLLVPGELILAKVEEKEMVGRFGMVLTEPPAQRLSSLTNRAL
ncbi:unnamed protein product, partial [Vitis vinifera]